MPRTLRATCAGVIAAGVLAAACQPAGGRQQERAPGAAEAAEALVAAEPPEAPGDADDALRVCSDPNNLPFSNDRSEGFENALAELLASDMGRPVRYTWWPQRRGFIRNTLDTRSCDVVMGVPAEYEMTRTTRPYYTSTYVFVMRADSARRIRSLDDPALRDLRIGLHVIGDDYGNVPPAQALAARGIIANVRGYSIYGDYSQPSPPASLIAAVAAGEVDVAVAWGPLAGYFASRQPAPLTVTPVQPVREGPVPFRYAIAMGVRRDDEVLQRRLDEFIRRRRQDIEKVLNDFGVPLVGPG